MIIYFSLNSNQLLAVFTFNTEVYTIFAYNYNKLCKYLERINIKRDLGALGGVEVYTTFAYNFNKLCKYLERINIKRDLGALGGVEVFGRQ